MSELAIEIQNLQKSFGTHQVLEDVSLQVPKGETFAFLGRNGQGKTTTIRILLGLLKTDGGKVIVNGLDPSSDFIAIRKRTGYLAEDQKMYGWMTVKEIMKFTKPFFPTWDDTLAEKLRKDFELPEKAKIKNLSKGQNVRLGLLLALAYRPELVILDDPTLGLDPIMRKEFMRDVIDHLQSSGATVFFSSHLLYEIEPVADRIAILDRGRIIRQEATEQLQENVRQFVVTETPAEKLRGIPGLLDIKTSNRQCALIVEQGKQARDYLQQASIRFEETSLTLDEIFEAYVIGNHGERFDDQESSVERVA